VIHSGVTVRRSGSEGAGAAGSFFLLVIGGGLTMVVIGLFLTGLAQEQIIPYFRNRAQTAMEGAKRKVEEKISPAAETEPEAQVPVEEEIDLLAAFLTQAETLRRMLEEERRELEVVRARIDSLRAVSAADQNEELTRQAKLLAGMRPDEAARVLSMMDDGSVRGIITAMNSRDAAKVVAQMDARRVARLSMTALRQAEASVQVRP